MMRALWWLSVLLVGLVLPVVSFGGGDASPSVSLAVSSFVPSGESPDRPVAPPVDPSTDGEGSDGEPEFDQDPPDPFQGSAYDAFVPPAGGTAELSIVRVDPPFELVTTSLYRPPRV